MGDEYLVLAHENQAVRIGHLVTLVLRGDLESVRSMLVLATTQVGYLVLEEDPIVARLTKATYASSSILDHVDTLTIRLKALNPNSIRAIFEYKYADVYGKKAKAVLTRQANAIAALVNVSGQTCTSCGTAATVESRFCRLCGAATGSVPAELDLMNVVANSHAGYLLVLQGTIGFFLAFLTLLLVLAIKGTAVLTAALVFTLIFAVPSFVLLLFGIRRLHRTVDISEPDIPSLAHKVPDQLNSALHRNTLSEFRPTSVTEGTTELLSPPRKKVTDKLDGS